MLSRTILYISALPLLHFRVSTPALSPLGLTSGVALLADVGAVRAERGQRQARLALHHVRAAVRDHPGAQRVVHVTPGRLRAEHRTGARSSRRCR